METPKKPVRKDAAANGTGAQKADEKTDINAKKRIIDDDDDDDDYDIPMDDLGRYENFESYDEDDDY